MDEVGTTKVPSTQAGSRTSYSALTSGSSTQIPGILHHILQCNLPSELPLRTMFSFNSGQRLPKLSEVYQFWTFEPKGRLVIEFLSSLNKITPSLDETPLEDIQFPASGPVENINPDHAPEDRFMDADNDRLLDFDFPQISDLYDRRESKGLPPDFVGNLCLNRIFTEPWETAELKNALTGLDYLSNLERTRRTALREAAERLHINEFTWHTVLADNREARAWVYSILAQEEEIELYYSTIWVDLRIWIMVKELRADPFYKPNVIAMLNTLFPPVIKHLPSTRISRKVIHKYRNTFYRYIVSVEAKGKSVIDDFVERLNRPGTSHTWPITRQNLKDYVKLTDSMIKQAAAVHGTSFFKNRPEDSSLVRPRNISGATSEFSDGISTETSANTSFEELHRLSTKSGARGDNKSSTGGSTQGASLTRNSREQKFVPVTRSKISGRPLDPQKLSSQSDIDTIFQGSPPTPWYSSPRRRSSVSGRGSIDTGSTSARLRSDSFSRPTTPLLDQQKLHGRTSSVAKRLSYDFRAMLPGTPELPSPSPPSRNIFQSKVPATFQATLPSDNGAFLEETNDSSQPVTKTKKSAFKLFRRKKKPIVPQTPDLNANLVGVPILKTPIASRNRIGTFHNAEGTFLAEPPTVKKKSSFGFLKARKSRDESRTVSESNSERTITDGIARQRFKLKAKSSFGSFFADKDANRSDMSFEPGERQENYTKTGDKLPRRHITLKKQRSRSSVKSSNSTKSETNIPKSGTSSKFSDDRIITSDDIAEPFPFGTFVQPQTPAMLLENSGEFDCIEDMRQLLLEKSRLERMEKWAQSEEFRRKLEFAREKRREERAKRDPESMLFKSSKQKPRAIGDTRNENQMETVSKCAPQTPKSPEISTPGSDKTPKTPLKARIIKEIASAYSPTMR